MISVFLQIYKDNIYLFDSGISIFLIPQILGYCSWQKKTFDEYK
jgi:hypothetical protein